MQDDALVAEVLKDVIDPELGVNIVDLGLVYRTARDGDRAQVRMTMTTPACPLGPYLTEEVEKALLASDPRLKKVEVEVVFDPPWSAEKMSDEAKRQLGWASP